jgi:glutathione S-transferase
MFARVEAELSARQSGPWFAGEGFSLVDAVYGPVFRYFDTFDRIGDFGILDGKPLVQAWREALSERRSVTEAVSPDYPRRLQDFLRAKGSYLSGIIRRQAIATPQARSA